MTQREGDSRLKESLGGISRFETVNTKNIYQMQAILKIVKEPEVMKHLADISLDTKIDDLVRHYADGRMGVVALDEIGEVVGVFDISSQGPQAIKEGDRAWHIQSGSLGRVCIPTEKQQKGRGTKLIEYAEEIGLENYPVLRAGIILDDEQKERYEKALEANAENEFWEWFRSNDARGKLFLRNRGWRAVGIFRDQGGVAGQDKLDSVVIVEKTRKDFEREKTKK